MNRETRKKSIKHAVYPFLLAAFIIYHRTDTAPGDFSDLALPDGIVPALGNYHNGDCPVTNLTAVAASLRDKAGHEHALGNYSGVVAEVENYLHYGRTIMLESPTYVIFLAGKGIEGNALREIQHFARDPQFPGQYLRDLLEIVNDIPPYAAMMQHAMKTEFWRHAVFVDEFTSGVERAWAVLHEKEPGCVTRFAIRSFFLPNQTKIELAGYYRALNGELPKLYREMDWESDKIGLYSRVRSASVLGKLKYAVVDKNIMGKTFVCLLYPGHKTLENRCRYDADLAATKIILACNLFLRETGRKPFALGELVPDYLDSVPLDPFDGAPFRYNREFGTVYSVGKSLADSGGADDTAGRGKNAVFGVWNE